MAKTARKMAALVMAAVIVAAPSTAAAAVTSSPESPNAHVRSDSAAIVALIERASDDSVTFRRLVDDINASDDIVYVQEGDCLDSAHACLIGVTIAGSSRALWVRVNVKMRNPDWDVMGSIAHELRHTLEVLAVPSVTSTASMQMFYRGVGFRGSARGYETRAAIDAGNAVRSEVRASIRRAKDE
jgi:hypothetical protein